MSSGRPAAMDRRAFLGALSGMAALAVGAARPAGVLAPAADGVRSAPFLIPMDETQPQPLKAYGIVYRSLQRGARADWLLDYRGGSFLVHDEAGFDESLARNVLTRDAAAAATDVADEIARGAALPMRLEVAPRIAVYAPPYAAPWDDAVRLALEYAEIPYRTVWDTDLLSDGMAEVEWLHLHHEDFTGQYGKYGAGVHATDWYRRAVALDQETADALGYAGAPELKRAVALAIRAFVERGGFLFAMCAATETLDVALAGPGNEYSATLAFTGFQVEPSPVGPFSTIDGHRVNTPDRLPLDRVVVRRFAPHVDPVAAMLTQDHATMFHDWYGLTTSFQAATLKPDVVVLATCRDGALAKYVHGDRGRGTFTFLGGHDPEDESHAVGDPPTDLRLHPRSPGYRLVLNNVLFPAARQEERKT